MDNLKHTVEVLWGSEGVCETDDTSSYGFATDAELTAFLLGVDEASGWLDYTVIELYGEEVA